ncbi:MAG: methyltransferase [Abditibacteriota bacterium]|nr:methyltransferase [Abditibacteriota bacterium]
MAATPRELVYQTLNFEDPARIPLELWYLPIAQIKYPGKVEELFALYDNFDTTGAAPYCSEPDYAQGDPYAVGTFRDSWGCIFENIQAGVIGEVKDPLVKDWETDRAQVHFPTEWLTIDPDAINRDCAKTDKFVKAGCCPRPFEQLQFIRGTVNLYMDLIDENRQMKAFLDDMAALYYRCMELWAGTDVDCLLFMDDWGSQKSLLISPELWRAYFKPIYKNFIDIAHAAGKKIFMHSDGYILEIYPDLVELGLDMLNSQIFCMGLENLEPFAGKITFCGEIDRQHLLRTGTPEDIDRAVKEVYRRLYRKGGIIGQCEFGDSAPENVFQVYKSWSSIRKGE